MIQQNQTIGDWDASQLAKFINDMLSANPNPKFGSIQVDDIIVRQQLVLLDTVTAVQGSVVTKIGASGAPAFENSWVNYAAGTQVAGYWRDPLGIVHLQGMIKSGTVGNAAFTLPPGFRPVTGTEVFGTVSNGAIGRVDVTTGGAVTPVSPSSNVYVSLSGMTFRTT